MNQQKQIKMAGNKFNTEFAIRGAHGDHLHYPAPREEGAHPEAVPAG